MTGRNDNLGKVYLDVAFTIGLVVTVGVIIDLLRGGGVEISAVAGSVAIYVAFAIGALRLGVSPIDYLRDFRRRGSLPK